jgi:hypothetical protein
MPGVDPDVQLRMVAFDHVRRLTDLHGDLTHHHLAAGFTFQGERVSLVNPQRGIFKPQRMRFLLSIRTVYPKAGGASGTTISATCTSRFLSGTNVSGLEEFAAGSPVCSNCASEVRA